MRIDKYKESLNELSGKTIAIVYVFEGKNEINAERYDVWKSDVLISWITACSELNMFPLLLDVDTFCFKAFTGTLPNIDYVINLSNGCYDLSVLGMIPAICSYLKIPCIPNNATATIIGENKKVSNHIANECGFNIPPKATSENGNTILRANNLGSSCGTLKGGKRRNNKDFCQKFINGFDLTVPCLYNPLSEELEVSTPIMYINNSKDINWYLGETEKKKRNSYTKHAAFIDEKAVKRIKNLTTNEFDIETYCRIDFRILCSSKSEIEFYLKNAIPDEKMYFIEINPLPTIKENVNFTNSISNKSEFNALKQALNIYNEIIKNATDTGFVLSSSILSFTTKHYI